MAARFEDGGEVGRSDRCKISEERGPEEAEMEGKGSWGLWRRGGMQRGKGAA